MYFSFTLLVSLWLISAPCRRSEYQLARPSDSHRKEMLFGSLAKPGHPMSKFCWGKSRFINAHRPDRNSSYSVTPTTNVCWGSDQHSSDPNKPLQVVSIRIARWTLCCVVRKRSDIKTRAQREADQHVPAAPGLLEEILLCSLHDARRSVQRYSNSQKASPQSRGMLANLLICAETLDTLEQWVREIFNQVPNK